MSEVKESKETKEAKQGLDAKEMEQQAELARREKLKRDLARFKTEINKAVLVLNDEPGTFVLKAPASVTEAFKNVDLKALEDMERTSGFAKPANPQFVATESDLIASYVSAFDKVDHSFVLREDNDPSTWGKPEPLGHFSVSTKYQIDDERAPFDAIARSIKTEAIDHGAIAVWIRDLSITYPSGHVKVHTKYVTTEIQCRLRNYRNLRSQDLPGFKPADESFQKDMKHALECETLIGTVTACWNKLSSGRKLGVDSAPTIQLFRMHVGLLQRFDMTISKHQAWIMDWRLQVQGLLAEPNHILECLKQFGTLTGFEAAVGVKAMWDRVLVAAATAQKNKGPELLQLAAPKKRQRDDEEYKEQQGAGAPSAAKKRKTFDMRYTIRCLQDAIDAQLHNNGMKMMAIKDSCKIDNCGMYRDSSHTAAEYLTKYDEIVAGFIKHLVGKSAKRVGYETSAIDDSLGGAAEFDKDTRIQVTFVWE